MKIAHKLYLCLFFATLVLAAGCPNVSKPYPERTYFLFEIPNPTSHMAMVQGATLDVNRFSISPSSEGREFIYRTTDLEYQSDFYNQFFRPPDNIMTEAVRQWLDQTGLFEDVLTPVSQAIGNYAVEGNIVELYGDYRNQASAKAVLKIQFFFLNTSQDNEEPVILLSKTYEAAQPIGTASPQNLMNGWNKALETILNEFLSDLSYQLKQDQINSYNQPPSS